MFNIKLGVPEMDLLWQDLKEKNRKGKANKQEQKLYARLGKTLKHLSLNPKYPSLNTHEISALTRRYGTKVFESYLENNTSSAGRLFWVYGPNIMDITVIGLEPHPNDKSNAYKKITLSAMQE